MSGLVLDPRDLMTQFPERTKATFPEITFGDDYREADYALLLLEPSSGFYFKATGDYFELNICVESGIDLEKVKAIRAAVPKVIINVDIDLPWILVNIEPHADALLAGFNTFSWGTMDIILGRFNPTGKLPFTLPANDEVIAIDENGICASPKDVPGFDKHEYMNGKEYASKDEAGNRYKYGFGLRYEE